jgi:uncharacterized membrane protein YcaP (DUF421 family)
VFDFGTAWYLIIVRTAVVYFAVLIGLRVTGKRQIGQMAPFDLVLILLIANAVQNAMVGPDTSLVGGLVAAGVLLLINLGVSRFDEDVPGIRRFARGSPAVLVSQGVIDERAMRREGVDLDDLEQAVREHSISSLDDVELAVLEVDGSVSIVPKGKGTVRTRKRFRQVRKQQ